MRSSKILSCSQKINPNVEDQIFFERFVDRVSASIFNPEGVKYRHWVDLASNSLLGLSFDFEANINDERIAGKSCYFEVVTPSFQLGQIHILEKDIVFMVDKVVLT